MKNQMIKNILWMFSILPVLVTAQTNYFNRRYELNPYNTWDYSTTVLEVDDGYIINGATGGQYGLHTKALIKIDYLGNTHWIRLCGDSLNGYDAGYPGSMCKYANGIYYGTGSARSYTVNWVYDRGLLIKYNSGFDTLWKKEYGETSTPFDTSYLFRNLTFAMDGGIVMVGSFGNETGNTDAHAYLIRTDTSGNKLWEHVYSNLPGDVQGYSVISTTDGGYAIGAFQYYHGLPSDETGDPLVIKTDSLGNFEWVRNLGGGYSDSHDMLSLSNDGNILAYCTYAVLNNPGSDSYKSPQVTKLDNNGSIIWERRYLKPKHFTYPGNLYVDADGSIILCGKTMVSFPRNTGWMMKLTSDGDSLWYRQYSLMIGNDSEHMLYDAIPTSDNGYIACGYVNPVLPDTGTQDVWVVKVDSLGCESPDFCWVSIKEVQQVPPLGELTIFPNPAQEVFTVQFRQPDKSSLLQFVDITGRKVEEISISPSETTQVISCSHWPPGMYLGQLKFDGKILARGKVVIK